MAIPGRWSWVVGVGLGALALAATVTGCAATAEPQTEEEDDFDGPEPTGDRGDAVNGGTVADAISGGCSTSSVLGLSLQIIAEGKCLQPDAFVEVPARPNLSLGANVFGYLEKPARDALVAALDAKPSKTLTVNSMFRTVAQQYLLYRWYQNGKCGISAAAKPGNSNHETGLALDTSDYSSWKSTLQSKGFSWFGGGDPPHFDYKGAGAVSYKGVDVLAFQKLWNLNHPEDTIAADGAWGPNTEARMKKAPAAGFPLGAECLAPPADGGGGAACTHDLCTTGGALDASCDTCATKVCASDSYCCTQTWDATCIGEVASVCGQSCGAPPPAQACGAYPAGSYQCGPDGNGRGRCDSGSLTYEACASGCLIQSGDDVCMGSTTTWSCNGSYGTAKAQNGDYYGTAFGCWVDGNGDPQGDPGDNCIPGCLSQAKTDGLCANMSGPQCERATQWYAADAGRFGCLARLRVTNPDNGKSVVVVALDYGPSCTIEKNVSHHVIDLSYPAENYLFGGATSASEKALAHVVEVDPKTPLGPVN